MARTPTKVVQIKKKIVNPKNSLRYKWGLSTSDMNYFLVKNSKIGITEKFWKNIPACTIFPIM